MLIMREIIIGNQSIQIKDYHCSNGNGYLPKDDGKLWLYVNLTDICNGRCPFCINPCRKSGVNPFDIQRFRKCLNRIREHVYGVSVTGGEPMLDPELLDAVADVVVRECGHDQEMDIVTNGTGFQRVKDLRHLTDLYSIHLSRHRLTDEENDRLFGFPSVSWEELRETISSLKDPGAVVLNCVLMRGGIDSLENISAYLEKAISVGVRNVSFIGMSKCNRWCEEYYIDPGEIQIKEDARFHIWSSYQDHDWCCCRSGSYEANNRSIRFYMRGMGHETPDYTRQFVYTSDNRLLAGFGGKEICLE